MVFVIRRKNTMEMKLTISRANIKPIILWGTYILFFLFNLSLTLESYREYEYIAGDIFLVITSVLGFLGMGIFFVLKMKSKKET
jgi:hypothetical protein